VGRAPDGRVVFVPFTAPGDRVRVQVQERHARFVRARIDTLLEPGPARTDPLCPVFGSCGGCAWQHVAYSAQLEAKAKILADAFSRIGGLALPAPPQIVPAPRPYGYRSRARVLVQRGRVGFRRRRSSAVCATSRCPVLVPELDAKLSGLAARPGGRAGEWELAAGSGAARASRLPGRRGRRVTLVVGPDRIGVSPGVFAQANADLLGPLAEAVTAAAGRGRLALELFAGAGFLTLGLARSFERVVALEGSVAAVRDLRANLRVAKVLNTEVHAERLESALRRGVFDDLTPDVLVLDPPRVGLSSEAARSLAGLGSHRVVYLSCDPATLARDAALFVDRGYALRDVVGFDLLPQTFHVEALAVLERT
jgi:23S rRNA (uracil1939-C5)-methyltransferase